MIYASSMWIVPVVLLFFLCMMKEASQVGHSASCAQESVAVGCWRQSLFRLPAPRTSAHSKQGHPFRTSTRKHSFEVYGVKHPDSNPPVDKEPDIGEVAWHWTNK